MSDKYKGILIFPNGMPKEEVPSSEKIKQMNGGKEILHPHWCTCTRCGRTFQAGRQELACPECFQQLQMEAMAVEAGGASNGNLGRNATRVTRGNKAEMGQVYRRNLPGEGKRIMIAR